VVCRAEDRQWTLVDGRNFCNSAHKGLVIREQVSYFVPASEMEQGPDGEGRWKNEKER
jgi:hypothetical protein